MTGRCSSGWAAFLRSVMIAALLAVVAESADAHFQLDARNRVFIVEPASEGMRVYMRIPTTLVYADHLAVRGGPDARVEAPFVVASRGPGGWMHHLDTEGILADQEGFGRLVLAGYGFVADGRDIAPILTALRVHGIDDAPPFGTPEEARAALQGPVVPDAAGMFVGETTVDVALLLPGFHGNGALTVRSRLAELELPSEVIIDNHFIDFRGGVRVTNVPGQMTEGVALDASLLRAAATFVVQGIRHILEGADHVLFVLCLTIGAATVGALVWQVSGFTVGHSITLIAGFLGLVPAGAWFTPAVEAAIALSIVYAGVVALLRRSGRGTVGITTAIGLLHGFGFAFVLQDILGPAAPHLGVSLLSFNIGVEVGQLAIVAVAWSVLAGIGTLNRTAARYGRLAIAGGAIAIACLWVVERIRLIAEAVAGTA